MGIKVTVNGDSRHYKYGAENWLTSQITDRQKKGERISVSISIQTSAINLTLNCPAESGSHARIASNPEEQQILNEWQRLYRATEVLDTGRILAFLNRAYLILN